MRLVETQITIFCAALVFICSTAVWSLDMMSELLVQGEGLSLLRARACSTPTLIDRYLDRSRLRDIIS